MLYIPLYIKSEYSLLDSLIKIKDLVNFAKENNYKALALTDDNLCGVFEFYSECIKNDIKPIIGLNIKIDDLYINLYAKDNVGYKNLIKIDLNKDELDLNTLGEYSDSLIAIIPFESRKLYKDLNKIYKDIFIGYQSESEKESINLDNKVYMNKILYLNKEDKKYYKYLLGINGSKTIDEIYYDGDDYFRLNKDVNDIYKYIYDNCSVEIKKDNDVMPLYSNDENFDAYSTLKEMCKNGLKKIFGDRVSKIYIDRLKYELEIINKMGFCNYFLIVMDYVKFAKESNILVGPGRGSAAGSLVSYVLGITNIDPIKYNLLFERFLNPNRVTMPDIDIDFEDNRREEVIEYCKNKYGEKNVAGIISFATLASRQVLRDVSKVMDYDQEKIDYIVKLIDSKISLEKNMNNPKIKEILNTNKDFKEVYDIALKLEGIKKNTTVHAAGIVMSRYSLDEILPIVRHDNMYLTCFTKDYLEDLGLLKMDFLALKNLSLITEILNDLKKDNIEIDFDKIDLNDKETFEIFKSGNTLGIFQFESNGMKNFLKKLKPDNLEDLFSANAIFRPGPMDNIDKFISRKHGREKIDYIDERLKDILYPTYGIIVYQEQIMKISNVMASYSLGEADILRRAMSKKKEDIILKEKDKFISNSIKNGYSLEVASKVFDLILKFSAYGFNRSHAVSYSIISYKMAYLKAHYNKYFMKRLLDNVIGTSSMKDYIYEAKACNIKIYKPDVNLSNSYFTVLSDGLMYPLNSIKNIGYNAINNIIEERKKSPFKDIFDFTCRLYSNVINKKAIVSLIDAGAFDSFNVNHKTLIDNIDIIINYAELYKELGDDTSKPNLIESDEFDSKELLQRSFNVIGFYLSDHPVTIYKSKNRDLIDLNNITLYFDKIINIVGMVSKIKVIDTKKNEKMCFISIEDDFSALEIIVFPKLFSELEKIDIGDILLINGRVEKRFDEYQLIANRIKKA